MTLRNPFIICKNWFQYLIFHLSCCFLREKIGKVPWIKSCRTCACFVLWYHIFYVWNISKLFEPCYSRFYSLCTFFLCVTKFTICVHVGWLMLSLMPLITKVSRSPWRIPLYFWYWWRKMHDFLRSDMLNFVTHNPTSQRISWEHFSYGNWPNSVANWHSSTLLNWRKDTVVFACWNNNEHQQR